MLQKVVDEHRSPLFVLRPAQQVLHQEGLVAGGGHLGHEEHVAGVDGGLVLVAQVGVHGVAHLVGQGELAAQGVLVVEQHEGVDPAAAGVGPAPLALVLPDVHPPLVEAGGQDPVVLLPQDTSGLQDLLPGLLEAHRLVCLREHGGVEVVCMELLQAQDLLAQGHVPMELVQVLVDRREQVVVDLLRHLRGEEGTGEGAGVLPRPGVEDVRADLGVQHGGKGVAACAVDAVDGLEGVLPQRPVRALQQGEERAVAHGVLPALAVHHAGELHVRVGVAGVDAAGAPAELSGPGKQVLLRGGEDVLPLQPGLGQVPAVLLQGGELGVEALQRLLGDGGELRTRIGPGPPHLHAEAEAPALHGLVLGVGGVLVVAEHGVDIQGLHPLVQPLVELQVLIEALGRLPQLPPESGQLPGQALTGLERPAPRLVAGEKVLRGPALGPVQLLPPGDARFMCHRLFLLIKLPAPAGLSDAILPHFSEKDKALLSEDL